MMLHTCRGMRGYSGAPILVSGADDEIQIAGIHVAMSRNNGAPRMFAVPAQAIACRAGARTGESCVQAMQVLSWWRAWRTAAGSSDQRLTVADTRSAVTMRAGLAWLVASRRSFTQLAS